MKIDFVSDVSCPWCAIGLKGLERALQRLEGQVDADIHFQPFELNPQMPAGGQDIAEHIAEKYGSSPQQIASSSDAIRARGAELGFTFDMERRRRIYNTFDAHRLLHWAGLTGQQLQLKEALLQMYFGEGRDPSDHEVLAAAAAKAGLDEAQARAVLSSGEYAAEVREREEFYRNRGIQAVPSIIVNDQYLIQGGQPPEAFEQVLRQIAAGKG